MKVVNTRIIIIIREFSVECFLMSGNERFCLCTIFHDRPMHDIYVAGVENQLSIGASKYDHTRHNGYVKLRFLVYFILGRGGFNVSHVYFAIRYALVCNVLFGNTTFRITRVSNVPLVLTKLPEKMKPCKYFQMSNKSDYKSIFYTSPWDTSNCSAQDPYVTLALEDESSDAP